MTLTFKLAITALAFTPVVAGLMLGRLATLAHIEATITIAEL
jgi:hypothetical protein